MFFDGFGVGFHDEFAAGEGGDEHHQGAAGEVEVGLQGIDRFELVRRVDEDIGFAVAFGNFAIAGEVLEHTGHGGADGGDLGGLLDFVGGGGIERVVLGVHVVVARVFCFDGAEGTHSDVQGQEGVIESGQNFRSEVQSGSGRGNGAFFAGVDGLVSVAVGLVGFAFHVVGQGEVAVFFEVGWSVPLDEALAFVVGFENGTGALADFHGATGFHLLSGPDEAPPMVGVGGVGADELDGAVVGEEAGRDDFGVVQDKEVVGWKEVLEVVEVVMGNFSGGAIDEHHARGRPVLKWARGDEFLGKVVVEIGEVHGRIRSNERIFRFESGKEGKVPVGGVEGFDAVGQAKGGDSGIVNFGPLKFGFFGDFAECLEVGRAFGEELQGGTLEPVVEEGERDRKARGWRVNSRVSADADELMDARPRDGPWGLAIAK